MKFVRIAAQCTLFDHKQYQDILNKLQTVPLLGKINNYRYKWIHPPSRAQVKKVLIYFFSSPHSFMVWTKKPLHCLQNILEWTDQHLYTLLWNINWQEKECRTSIKEAWDVTLRMEWAKRPKSLKAQWWWWWRFGAAAAAMMLKYCMKCHGNTERFWIHCCSVADLSEQFLL